MEFIYEVMEKNTKVVDKIIKCMEWDRLYGLMEENIVANTMKIKNKVMEHLNGGTEKNNWELA